MDRNLGESTGPDCNAAISPERFNPLISYPFPVEGGERVGNVRVPKYVTQEDADRLKAFVQTLVMEPS